MTLQPALPAKSFRHDIESEMRLAARPVSGMAFVPMRLVFHAEAVGRESFVQLFRDEIACGHGYVSPGMNRKNVSPMLQKDHAPSENARSRSGDACFCLLSSLEAAID